VRPKQACRSPPDEHLARRHARAGPRSTDALSSDGDGPCIVMRLASQSTAALAPSMVDCPLAGVASWPLPAGYASGPSDGRHARRIASRQVCCVAIASEQPEPRPHVAQTHRRRLSCNLQAISPFRFYSHNSATQETHFSQSRDRPATKGYSETTGRQRMATIRRRRRYKALQNPVLLEPGTSSTRMNAQHANAALRALLDSQENRTKMARFRDVALTVDELVTSGVKREVIRQTLASQGLELTPGAFKTYLERWRAERSDLNIQSAAAPAVRAARPAPMADSAHLSGQTPSALSRDAAPPPAARSIREIRQAEVDFAGADKWHRERVRQRQAEQRRASAGPQP
jgi:hypothetical protein